MALATFSEKSPTRRVVGEPLQVIVIAHEIAVGVAGADLLKNPVIARL